MKRKAIILKGVFFGIASLFLATTIYAGAEVADEIKMETKAYEKHTKGIVVFTHKKHAEEYTMGKDKAKIKCGACHHDKDNKPLDNLKECDKVQKCIECHKKPGMIKGKEAKGLKKEQQREYHANAIHDNCKDCHKKFNKEKGLKAKDKGAAPTSCKACHPKTGNDNDEEDEDKE